MAALPHSLEQRLAALVPRVRTLRVTRGASVCLLAAVVSTVFVLLLDALVSLPATARGLFIAVWVTALGVLVWQLILRPWHADIPFSEVARELEKRLPELGARLGAVVGTPHPETSDAVRAALVEDAARRAKAVDFSRAIRAYPAMLRACGAILTFLAFLMAVGLVPNSGERLRRVAMPWVRGPAASVRVIVTSGEPVVKRGGPVTLTAYTQKIDTRASSRDGAVLVYRDGSDAPEHRLPMTADDAGAFHVTRPEVPGDFEYRVQIGGATSEWFRVTALDAVEFAEGTQIEIVPPRYAKQPNRVFTKLTDFDAPEFSRIGAQLKFTRPAAGAHFEWRASSEAKPEQIPIELAPDRLSGSAAVILRRSGELRLVLLREANGKTLRTTTAVGVRVTPDRAPWFESLSGVTSRPRTTRPSASVPIRVVARDDMSVSTAVVEYVLDSFDSRTETVPIPLVGAGTARATGKFDFDLAPLAVASGKILFRVRVTDNRNADDPKLSPQDAFYPTTGWSELRLSATAPPLNEQDILCERDSFGEAAEAGRLAVRETADTVSSVRIDATGRVDLAVDHTTRLHNARERIRRTAVILTDLAREVSLTPELRQLATAVREIAENELTAAEAATLKIEADETGRAEAFAAAVKQLGDAGDKLDVLLARNTNLARDRLDRAKLGALAVDQTALAGVAKAGEKELHTRQQELVARLRSLLAESEPLRTAAEGAKGNEARRLALAITELSALLRDLDTASRRTATDARDALVADIARDQESLNTRAAKLFATLDVSARLAGVAPPRLDDFRRVADLAAAGKPVEALTELEKQSQALERIATEFDTWAADRADPKRGAKQLALWQDDLLARLRATTKATDFDKLPDDTKTAFRTEQKVIHATLALLAIPPDAAVKAASDNAAIHTGTAHGLLSNDGRGAEAAMKLAVDSLNRLAEKTPSVAERLAKALREFDKLRPEQDTLANAVEQALRGHDGQAPTPAIVASITKKLAPLVERQRKVVGAFAALDLPGLGARQARVAGALAVAIADLQDGSPFDVQASQLAVRREFERLKLMLEGIPPPDAKADELHRLVNTIADALDLHGENIAAKLLEPAAPVVQDAQKQLAFLIAPDAPGLMNDAKVALQFAESGLRDSSKPDAARLRIRAAADALGRLSVRLNGTETDLDRVNRFANNRRLAAVRAKELADAKAPFSVPASDEAKRQLVRELEELAHTRVGGAGQINKHRVLDLYAKLRTKIEPDRLASDQRALAEALDELAAKMADIAELATLAESADPHSTPKADAYLPSKPLAGAIRGLVKQQRTLRDGLTNFARALAERLRPAAVHPFTELEAKQRAIAAELFALAPEAEPASKVARAAADALRTGNPLVAKEMTETVTNLLRELLLIGEGKPWGARAKDLVARQQAVLDDLTKLAGASNAATAQQVARASELAGRAAELARVLELAAKGLDPTDSTAKTFVAAAGQLKDAEKRLLEASQRSATTNISDAARLRAEADTLLRAASARVSGAVPAAPAGASSATGDALRAAELAMRTAIEDLASGTPATAEKAMREAANALTTAKSVGR